MATHVPMKADLEPRSVYRCVARGKVACNLGSEHEVSMFVRKLLGPVVDQVSYDNGYGVDSVPVRLDAQGRRYQARFPIDFHGHVTWVREGDPGHWQQSAPRFPDRVIRPAEYEAIFAQQVTAGMFSIAELPPSKA
jgi:hypothetical protein